MKQAVIVIGAILAWGGARETRAVLLPVNSNTVAQDGIEYYIQTDNAVYDLGEDVELLFRMTNLTDEEWYVRWLGSGVNIVIEAEGEAGEVWAWSWWQFFDTGPQIIRLQTGESLEIGDVWPQLDYGGIPDPEGGVPAGPGTYTVTGSFEPMDVSVSVDVAIVPEPATIILLCGGVALLRFGRRMS